MYRSSSQCQTWQPSLLLLADGETMLVWLGSLRDLMLKPAGPWLDPYFHLLIHCILLRSGGDRTAAKYFGSSGPFPASCGRRSCLNNHVAVRHFRHPRVAQHKSSFDSVFGSGAFNPLRPIQNGRHFSDDTLNRIFLNENVGISIKISLKFARKGPINNIPALVQIMAWCRADDKPLSEPMMVSLLTHICATRPQWVNRDTAVEAGSLMLYILSDGLMGPSGGPHC